MELIKLRYFTEVCRYGSMTRAAEALFVSQQNVSKAVSSLEKELGVPLFVRSGTNLSLTTDGEYLLQKANWILAEANVVDSHFQKKRQKGDLITVESAFGILPRCGKKVQQLLLDSSRAFNVSFVQKNERVIEEDVRRGAVRFGLLHQPSAATDFDAILLREDAICFIVSRRHPLAERERVTLYQMAQYPMVMPDEHTAGGQLVNSLFRKKGVVPYVILPSLAISEITRLTRANENFIGCAVENDLACVRTEGLVRLDCAEKTEMLQTYLICRRGVKLSKHEKEFRRELCATFNGESDEPEKPI